MRSSSPARLWLAFVPYGVVGVIHIVALQSASAWPDAAALAAVSKTLLMPALALGFLVGVPTLRASATILGLLALLFSWAGDLALLVPGHTMFLLGLAAFLAAHVFFVLLIARHLSVRRLPLASLAYLGWWIALMALLAPHVGWLVWPLATYGLVLGFMAATAARSIGPVVIGGLLFLVSDTILGIDRFMPSFPIWNADVVIMVAYIAAQGFLAAGAVLHLRASAALGANARPGIVASDDLPARVDATIAP
jgi:uncharacterized membrane protein YhhN